MTASQAANSVKHVPKNPSTYKGKNLFPIITRSTQHRAEHTGRLSQAGTAKGVFQKIPSMHLHVLQRASLASWKALSGATCPQSDCWSVCQGSARMLQQQAGCSFEPPTDDVFAVGCQSACGHLVSQVQKNIPQEGSPEVSHVTASDQPGPSPSAE